MTNLLKLAWVKHQTKKARGQQMYELFFKNTAEWHEKRFGPYKSTFGEKIIALLFWATIVLATIGLLYITGEIK